MSDAELLDLARTVAGEAAALVRARRAAGVTVAATKSSPVDVVTEADRACEELIRERVLAARPGDGFLGEEGEELVGTSGVTWVVDPIDGTVNFLYGIPQYAVSIAAERDGAAVAGVVVDVASGVEYHATRCGGAWRDGTRLGVRAPAPTSERLVLTGFNYEAHVREVQAAAVARLLPQVRDIRRLGSCALDLCHVAEGSADAYVEEGVSPWDHAAGGLVAREAGARTELSVGRGGKTALLCAPGHGFTEFRTLVTECGFLARPAGE
ncbi:inositol monophosphatase family protein [Nocardioides donggukensis]|uniref:Inositol-1-monophosphatase n=1 Tax=Nocardioides donggukensis TaxID=2774019 RepID=A0A927K5Q7_9ACTN|nr:inositol monophosphatase family protein [Nocardioides donggukensis]MBD8869630.1 inositol monophosphatase [Nocardioides donggukensis]